MHLLTAILALAAVAALECPKGTQRIATESAASADEWCALPDGTQHGPHASWFPGQVPRQSGVYRHGKAHGLWRYWYQSGTPRMSGPWRDGRPHGRWTYWRESGRAESEGPFKQGVRAGRWVHWLENGERSEGVWRHGKQEGLWKTFSAGGAETAWTEYRNGEALRVSRPTTMDALHQAGGVPPGWMFNPAAGDPAAGARQFNRLGCRSCHVVDDGSAAAAASGERRPGPDLTGMGEHHPPGYFAESIVNPDAVLIQGPGYIGADGRSTMPAYPEMTLAQLADVVAYLKDLKGPACH